MSHPNRRIRRLFATAFALAAGLLFATAAIAAGPKATAQPTGRTIAPRALACVPPLVASPDGKGCVCPEGTKPSGNQCVPAPGMRAIQPRGGLQKKAPTMIEAVPQRDGTLAPKRSGMDGPSAVMQKNRGLTRMTTRAGEFGTLLEVRQMSGDVMTAWGITHAIQTPQQLTFRWTTQAANPASARQRITGLTSNGSPVVLQDSMAPLPTGPYAFFNFPFPSGFESFIVQVTVIDGGGQEIQSVPVHITYGAPTGPTPRISMPQIILTITEIHMIDDSDLHGSGEVDFCAWATWTGGSTGQTIFSNDDIASGASFNPNATVVVDATPQNLTLHVKGRDSDTQSFTTVGCEGDTSDYDFATGQRHIHIGPAAADTPAHAFTDFPVHGTEDLEFVVKGTWKVKTP